MSEVKFVNFSSWFRLTSVTLQWPVIVAGMSSATIVQSKARQAARLFAETRQYTGIARNANKLHLAL
jgi:hypothetical protein